MGRYPGTLLTSLLFLLNAPLLMGQERDTSSLSYRIGYEIGSWLPFAIIVILVVMVLQRAGRFGKNK